MSPDAQPAAARSHGSRPPLWVALAWVGVAFMCCICGIGGGLFAVPLLHYGGKLPLRTSIGTALCLVFTLAVTATATEVLQPRPQLLVEVTVLLVAGALPGSQLGYWTARRLDPLTLKTLFVLVLVAAGLRVLTSAGHGGQVPGELSPAELGLVPLIGFAGGFLAPLLGIGGGLLVIPCLFLGFPTIGYLEARASSLAMAAVASGWSVRNYLRSREVDLDAVLPMAAATVVGAVAGVRAVHLPGWAAYARATLGVILVVVAARFAIDVVRMRRARQPGWAAPGED